MSQVSGIIYWYLNVYMSVFDSLHMCSEADIESPPYELLGGVRSRRGQPSWGKNEPDQNPLFAPPNFKKTIALAFLKVV